MTKTIKSLAAAAVLAIAPSFASAITLTVDDLGNAGVEFSASGSTIVNATGTYGAFTVGATTSISNTPSSATLNTTSINLVGVGTLQITAEETGLVGFAGPYLDLLGTATVSDFAESITVEHLVNIGSGYQTIDSVMTFVAGTPSASVWDRLASVASYDLKTIFTITTTATDQSANVNGTIVASPIPLPAGGLLLLSALGAGGIMSRRKNKAA